VNVPRGKAVDLVVVVSHHGDVHPSGFLPLTPGNVRDRGLVDIYRTAPLLTSLRDPTVLRGRCGACEFRSVCGGSRARAYGVTDDVSAEEPACSYQPGSFPYLEDLAETTSRCGRFPALPARTVATTPTGQDGSRLNPATLGLGRNVPIARSRKTP
jgi:radical SAM protein with 4Fe4S-binding SPASM domain